MKIYQGEPLTFILKIPEINGNKEGFTPRAALIIEQIRGNGCVCNGTNPQCHEVVVEWDNIEIADGLAIFSLPTEKSQDLVSGLYSLEIAMRNKSDNNDMKGKIKYAIEVQSSYTNE